MFKQGSRLRRRPSASMAVALIALFVALSGGAYAAGIIPNNSVGANQLKNGSVSNWKLASNAVGFRKIIPGTIGRVRVDDNAIQLRVSQACSGANAISAIANTGKVTCTPTVGGDYHTPGLTEPLSSTSSASVIASESVPAGDSFVIDAAPYIETTGTAGSQQVVVTCSLVAGTTTETHSLTLNLSTNNEQAAGSIPLSVTLTPQTSATNVAIGCVRGYTGATAPVAQASGTIDALQTGAITSTTTPGTSTSPVTITTPNGATGATGATGSIKLK